MPSSIRPGSLLYRRCRSTPSTPLFLPSKALRTWPAGTTKGADVPLVVFGGTATSFDLPARGFHPTFYVGPFYNLAHPTLDSNGQFPGDVSKITSIFPIHNGIASDSSHPKGRISPHVCLLGESFLVRFVQSTKSPIVLAIDDYHSLNIDGLSYCHSRGINMQLAFFNYWTFIAMRIRRKA